MENKLYSDSSVALRLHEMVVLMSVGHDSGDVSEQLHPGVLGQLVERVAGRQIWLHSMQEDSAHHTEVVAGNPGQPVKLAKLK